VATRRVWVCLEDAHGHLLINGQILDAGRVSQGFVSPAFRIYLGRGAVSFPINGCVHRVTPDPNPVAYRISRHGVVALRAGLRPMCAYPRPRRNCN
jgi:hypothetical protein